MQNYFKYRSKPNILARKIKHLGEKVPNWLLCSYTYRATRCYILMAERRLPFGSWQYGECFAVLEVERHLVEGCHTTLIQRKSRTNGIEAHGREHEPCRHLPRVVVARESTRRVVVFRIENMPYDPTCLLRLSYIVVKIWYLVARFVAVPVKRSC